MRTYENTLQEAELLASSPDTTAEFLRARAERPREAWRSDQLDAQGERALVARGVHRINLAVARYGRSSDAVRMTFETTPQSSPLRLAALSNRVVGTDLLSIRGFPGNLFANEDALVYWVNNAPEDELHALFGNPRLADDFLCGLLERKRQWNTVTDARLVAILAILINNPRMSTPYESKILDGYSEYSYGSVFNAAWLLAETAPTDERWAATLGWLYQKLELSSFQLKDPVGAGERWKPDPADSDAITKQVEQNANGWLTNRQRVRKGLGRLALSKNPKLFEELFHHDDLALRAAAYRAGRLTPENLKTAYERDGELMFEEACENSWVWRSAPTRQAFHDIAWAIVRSDKTSDLMAANVFEGMRERMYKEHPDWFNDDEDPPDVTGDSGRPATAGDLEAFAGRLEIVGSEQLAQRLTPIYSKLNWIWWFAAGALAMSIAHRL